MKNAACNNYVDVQSRKQEIIKLEIIKRVGLVKKVLVLLAKLKQLKAEKLNRIQKSKSDNLTAKVEAKIAMHYLIDIELLEALLKELEDVIKECEEYLNAAEHEQCLTLYAQAIQLTGRYEANAVALKY